MCSLTRICSLNRLCSLTRMCSLTGPHTNPQPHGSRAHREKRAEPRTVLIFFLYCFFSFRIAKSVQYHARHTFSKVFFVESRDSQYTRPLTFQNLSPSLSLSPLSSLSLSDKARALPYPGRPCAPTRPRRNTCAPRPPDNRWSGGDDDLTRICSLNRLCSLTRMCSLTGTKMIDGVIMILKRAISW